MSPISQATAVAGLLDDEHVAYRESVRTFLERHAAPDYPDWRARRAIPRAILERAAADGFLATQVPERFGGMGVDDVRFGVIAAQEAMAAGAPALALQFGLTGDVFVAALLRDAPDELTERWLPSIAAGRAVPAVVSTSEITIERTGETPTLTGTARCIPSGTDADVLLVLAGGSNPHVAVLAADEGCVDVTPADPGIGLDAAGLADITFDGAEAKLIGERASFERATADLALLMAVTATAGARAALALACDYVQDRKAFGQPIAAFENTRQLIGQAAADLEAAEAFVAQALRLALGGELGAALASALHLHCSTLFATVVDSAVQLHGGYGYMMEYPIAHLYADEPFWRLTGGGLQDLRERLGQARLS